VPPKGKLRSLQKRLARGVVIYSSEYVCHALLSIRKFVKLQRAFIIYRNLQFAAGEGEQGVIDEYRARGRTRGTG